MKCCDVVDVWILAGKHELESRHSMHAARTLLQQAIATNPDSQQLWLEVREVVDYYLIKLTRIFLLLLLLLLTLLNCQCCLQLLHLGGIAQ